MSAASAIASGTKVEMGQPGTPSYRVGLVLGMGSAEMLGRREDEPSELVVWESGEQEWVERDLLRVIEQ
jgi:hypothetical protein